MSFLSYLVALLVAFLDTDTITWELAYQVPLEVIQRYSLARDFELDAFGALEKV